MSGEALLAEVRKIASTGYAFDREEHEAGIRCVAAPVWSEDRSFVGGVSVTGPAYRLTMERLEEWSGPVRAAARSIMEGMRIRLGPRR
jgi:DNA-binding IclR family transcriptional regulator